MKKIIILYSKPPEQTVAGVATETPMVMGPVTPGGHGTDGPAEHHNP
jgi:hypothetical protein